MQSDSSSQEHSLHAVSASFADYDPHGEFLGNAVSGDATAAAAERLREADAETHANLESPAAFSESAESDAASINDAPLKTIGEFELIRELGRGGMGVVFLARQRFLQRVVALKILPYVSTLDPKQTQRFSNEARAAATIQHTNIVPVYVVGQEKGVHYYAMRYIDGRPLDDFVGDGDDASWMASGIEEQIRDGAAARDGGGSAEPGDKMHSADHHPMAESASRNEYAVASETLADLGTVAQARAVACIGVQVADALHHAHEYGIIHRDIKPSNLLLDHQGKAWVTDFGLARIQSDARVTQTNDIVGTLRYMSPEQALGASRVLDERTDIYSLGVTLYELLIHRAAYSGDDRQTIVNRIANDELPPPRRSNAAVPVDLETIVMKAVSRAPERRYSSGREFADDLKRFLEGKPILARRTTFVERAGMWLRRHRTFVRAASAMACVLLLVLALTTFSVLRANSRLAFAHEELRTANTQLSSALDASKANLDKSQQHFRQARQVVDLFGTRYADALASYPGAESLRYRVLRDTLEYYQRFVEQAEDDPTFHRDIAVTYTKMAELNTQLGHGQEGLKYYRLADDILGEMVGTNPASVNGRRELALCRNNVALLLAQMGDTNAAREAYENAIELQESLVQDDPASSEHRADLAVTRNNLALLEAELGHPEAARAHLASAVRLQQQLVDEEPENESYLARLALSLANESRMNSVDAMVSPTDRLAQAIDMQRRLLTLSPENEDYAYDLALSYQGLASVLLSRGDAVASEAACREAVTLLVGLAGKSPAVVKYALQAAVSRNNLGQALMKQNRYDEAKEQFIRAVDTLRRIVAKDSHEENPVVLGSLGGALSNLGMTYYRLGEMALATQAYEQAIANQRQAMRLAPKVMRYRQFLDVTYDNYAKLLEEQGAVERANQLRAEAAATRS